ncbi:MAG: hypothetical protein P4L79_10555 [Legionella sp.]|uniref:hypothetical protein n=1 Tax=Legionella sp. TaxID=459 RepID=UPI00285188C5|nr:hypothetical protein [Legionella sp.]
MILLDFNQIAISNLMENINTFQNTDVDLPSIRHMVLNTIRAIKIKFHDFGQLVICCDSRHYWRKDAFPYYKASRKKDRDASPLDWNKIHEYFNQLKSELTEVFPYRVIEVEGAEADDVIGVLAQEYGKDFCMGEQILICSEDKDFKQLHRFANVKQYGPIFKKDFIVVEDPDLFLKEQIIRGDRGDGIPNILSPANSIVIGKRQKSVMSKNLQEWVKKEPIDFCDPNMLARYIQNRQLIDLTYIPENIKIKIVESYKVQENKKCGNLFQYFMDNSLRLHMENIRDFK